MSSWSPLLSLLLNVLVTGTLASMVAGWVWLVVQLKNHRPFLPPLVVREVPWGFRTVLASVLSWFGLQVVVLLVYGALTHRRRGVSLAFTEQMFLVTVVNSLELFVLPLLLRTVGRAQAADLGLDLSRAGQSARVGAVAFLIVTWPVNLLHGLCVLLWPVHQKHPLEEMVRGGLDLPTAYLALLSAVVLAPAVEEILFRGIVQSWLSRVFRRWRLANVVQETGLEWVDEPPAADLDQPSKASGPASADWMPIVVTSAIFALAHAPQWPAPVPIFVLSLVLGFIYQRTGSLLASFVLHALFNGFSTLLLFWAIVNGGQQAAKAVPAPQSLAVPPAVLSADSAYPFVH
ncbi:MAG: CPBP family intramembrane metalloprotease [Isosphaeraceae bacterium]|nr:CPBP family intramembrane metalloprotease [Isosphaeraceae bacterium]